MSVLELAAAGPSEYIERRPPRHRRAPAL